MFGENKVQEANDKFSSIEENFKLHLIGPLQTNKAKLALTLFEPYKVLTDQNLSMKLQSTSSQI